MTALIETARTRTRWPAPMWLLLVAFLWSALVLVAALIGGLLAGFGLATLIGAAPMALWLSAAGWVGYGARTPARSPNIVPILLCGAFTLVAATSFVATLLVAIGPAAIMIVVAAALNLSRWPR